jgi:putative membrane protein
MVTILLNWAFSAVAIAITAYLLPGVSIDGVVPALVFALVFGLINALLRPLILLLTLPVNVVTLGLFTLVINAAMVLLAAKIVVGVSINGFWWALLFSVVLWLVQIGLSMFRPSERAQ